MTDGSCSGWGRRRRRRDGLLWLLQVRLHDATAVDVGWAYGIGVLGVLDAALGHGAGSQRALEGVLVAVWSLRLAPSSCAGRARP